MYPNLLVSINTYSQSFHVQIPSRCSFSFPFPPIYYMMDVIQANSMLQMDIEKKKKKSQSHPLPPQDTQSYWLPNGFLVSLKKALMDTLLGSHWHFRWVIPNTFCRLWHSTSLNGREKTHSFLLFLFFSLPDSSSNHLSLCSLPSLKRNREGEGRREGGSEKEGR